MSVALLDVNVLIAMFDPYHTHHDVAQEWFARESGRGWATCPLTVAGTARILSNPGYPRAISVESALQRIRNACAHARHEFWPADLSPLDSNVFRPAYIGGHRNLTDVYLLGVAVRRNGRLATFDRGLSPRAVIGATAMHLCVIG